jgi:hypothetical protein
MNTFTHRLVPLLVLLVWALTACTPAAPELAPTEVTLVIPTKTAAPTATLPPTATTTATPSPIPPTATNTPTPVPPTPTRTPAPTATATPGPGDIVYQPAQAADWARWGVLYFGTDNFTVDTAGSEVNFQIDGTQTWVYHVYERSFDYADVQIDADVLILAGPNRNNLSLVCRYSERGWYEFNILSGGLWSIYKYDDVNSYRELNSGGSTAIKMGQSMNHLTAVCAGDSLTFYVNDVEVGSAHDETFSDGAFGMSASTFDIGELEVRFSEFTVRLADPDAQLGNNVAPTVAPSGDAAETTAVDTFFNVPVPGDTLANATMQWDVLFSMFVLTQLDAPDGCQDVRVTNTAVTQIVQPFVVNAQGQIMEGEWIERWDVQACGAALGYHVDYQADGAGGTIYRISQAP